MEHIAEHIHSFSLNSLPWPVHGQAEQRYVGLDDDLPGGRPYFNILAEKQNCDSVTASASSHGEYWSSDLDDEENICPLPAGCAHSGPLPDREIPDTEPTHWQKILEGDQAHWNIDADEAWDHISESIYGKACIDTEGSNVLPDLENPAFGSSSVDLEHFIINAIPSLQDNLEGFITSQPLDDPDDPAHDMEDRKERGR
jgi:hypothetical protein